MCWLVSCPDGQAIMNVSSSVEKNVVTIETNPNNTTYIPNHSDENAFELIVKQSLYALIQSDVKRGEFSGNSDGSSSQGRWMDHTSGCMLGKALDCLIINVCAFVSSYPVFVLMESSLRHFD